MRIVKFLTEPRECADYLEARGLQMLTSDPKPARAAHEFAPSPQSPAVMHLGGPGLSHCLERFKDVGLYWAILN